MAARFCRAERSICDITCLARPISSSDTLPSALQICPITEKVAVKNAACTRSWRPRS